MSSKELQELRKRVLKAQLLLSQVAQATYLPPTGIPGDTGWYCISPKLMKAIQAEAEFVIVEKKDEDRS